MIAKKDVQPRGYWVCQLDQLRSHVEIANTRVPEGLRASYLQQNRLAKSVFDALRGGKFHLSEIQEELRREGFRHKMAREQPYELFHILGLGETVPARRDLMLDIHLEEGERDIKSLCEKLGVEPDVLKALFESKERFENALSSDGTLQARPLPYKALTPWIDSDDIARAMYSGLPLDECGEKYFGGLTTERVRGILDGRNVNELRMRNYERRKVYENTQTIQSRRQALCEILVNRAIQGSSQHTQRALSHFLVSRSHMPLKTLMRAYELHPVAERLQWTDTKLIQELGISYNQLRKFRRLAKLTEDSPRARFAREFDVDTLQGSTEAVYDIGFSVASIISFLRRYVGFHTRKVSRHSGHHFLASNVYEAQDAGFTISEIRQLTGLDEKRIHTYIDDRDKLAPVIVKGLQRLFQAPEIELPYLFAEKKQN